MADIAEQLCLAIDEIVKNRIDTIGFDSTIVATIVDDKEAKNNKYTCSNGTTQFIAYAKDGVYKINDSVQVVIPNNDYDQQKYIVGKYMSSYSAIPYNYTQPFDTIIDLSTNLISGINEKQYSLLANDNEIKEIAIWSDTFDTAYCDFTRIGVKGQFRSWLKNLKTIKGDYGYRLEVISNNGTTIEKNQEILVKNWSSLYSELLNGETPNTAIGLFNETPTEWFGDINKSDFITEYNNAENNKRATMVFAILGKNAQISMLYLDSSSMYGDPYNFQTYYEQETVFDISKINNIIGMSLYFYQRPGSFVDKDNNQTPHTQGILGTSLADNLFTKDPYICLGYSLTDFNDEQAILYTLDSKTYLAKDGVAETENTKTVRLRWLHRFENDEIKVITDDTLLEDYEIRWYRYKIGAPSADEYSGVHWMAERSTNDSHFIYKFIPDLGKQSEQIKAIILHKGKVIRSNTLIFQNEREIISGEVAKYVAGLSIWCDDADLSGLQQNLPTGSVKTVKNGNYHVYGQNNRLLNENQGNIVLTFEAHFADAKILSSTYDIDAKSPLLEHASEIIWEIPYKETMIVIDGFDYDGEENKWKLPGYYNDAEINVDEENNVVKIIRKGNADFTINAKQDYRIGKTYSQTYLNNTIKCTIKKDGIVYSATKDLTFGLMGTNGTDATLTIDFNNNKTALTAGEKESLKITARLYDSSHNEYDFTKGGNIEWKWTKTTLNPNSSVKIVVDNKAKNICYLEHNEINIEDNYFLILEATVKNFGNYDLTAYKAIPIRVNKQYRNYIGPTEIIYGTAGYPDYYKSPIELWYCDNEQDVNEYDIVEDYTKIVANTSSSWEIYNPLNEKQEYLGGIENNILKPSPIYVKEAKPYGVVGLDKEKKPIWVQPFVILQNQYPSSTLNKWNGKSIELNKDEGYIIAPAIAAGKKNSDNTFSGVMIGDWSNTDTASDIAKQTGVYGFHEGAMSFAFKEDGTAFIGKSGHGRILFNGSKSTITSNKFEKGQGGLSLDFDAGVIEMITPNDDPTKKYTIKFDVSKTKNPFTIGDYFKVDWDGSMIASNGSFTGTITSENGTIGGWEINESTLSSTENNLVLDSSDGSITGGILRGSAKIKVDGKEKTTNPIILDGYFTLNTDELNSYLGYLPANLIKDDEEEEDEAPGIGFKYVDVDDDDNEIEAKVKATGANSGLSFKKSLNNGSSGGWLSITDTSFRIKHDEKIIITAGTGENGIIEFNNIKPENQHGIYARFA